MPAFASVASLLGMPTARSLWLSPLKSPTASCTPKASPLPAGHAAYCGVRQRDSAWAGETRPPDEGRIQTRPAALVPYSLANGAPMMRLSRVPARASY